MFSKLQFIILPYITPRTRKEKRGNPQKLDFDRSAKKSLWKYLTELSYLRQVSYNKKT